MKSKVLRQTFLDYFKQRGHEIVESSSLVPHNDPTLLFTNAGMVQFKDVFLGLDPRSYTRACTSQTCVRAGGKHNDLENVGYTARHHTFFEMLGNFSFGDYFKREAIQYAWDFLTQVMKLPAEKLWVTVFEDDQEAEDIWLKEMKIDPKRFSRCGAEDNFWSMGDTGPCGPCSEIFYDHGADIFGGPPGTADADGDRYIEIWNMVFMQFDRQTSGELVALPKPSVDTGMGLERLAAVMQGVHNNYDTDLFVPLIQAIADLAKIDDLTHTSLRVIADHLRSCSFLIADGILPSNEGRGYVLRRIIRRAIRHGHALGLKDPFFYRLLPALIDVMGQAYPKLQERKALIERSLKQEEEQFSRTLEQGLKLFNQEVAKLTGQCIPGSIIFKLYDTYGFPPDLTADIARERNLHLDWEGFETEMKAQRELSAKANTFAADYHEKMAFEDKTDFRGYHSLVENADLIAMLVDGQKVDHLQQGQKAAIVLSHTPFYAESGGQVGDRGILSTSDFHFVVEDTQKQGKAIVHLGFVEKGELRLGMSLKAEVDGHLRAATARNHTATHLLHAALQTVVGPEIMQKGSLVAPDRLRFDFSYPRALTKEECKAAEALLNAEILKNTLVETHQMSIQEAKASGAMALFGEKYDETVRVLQVGDFSKELCGGTHVSRSGDIGLFKIVSESGIASGVRRIEALTGMGAYFFVDHLSEDFQALCDIFKINKEDAVSRATQLMERSKALEKELASLNSQLAGFRSQGLLQQAEDLGKLKFLSARLDDLDAKSLRELLLQTKEQLGSGLIILSSVQNDKVNLMVSVSADLTPKLHAGELLSFLAEQVGGKGGGRADLAQGGGTDPSRLKAALDNAKAWILQRVN